MGKKKILFVINSLGCGGAEKSLVSMLSSFDFDNYDVDLQMFNPGGMFMNLLPKEVNILPKLPFIKYCSEASGASKFANLRFFITRIKLSFGLRIIELIGKQKLHDAQKYWKFANKAFDKTEKEYDAAIAWGQGNPTHYVASKVKSERKIAVINADYEAVGHNKQFDYKYYKEYDYTAAVSDKLQEIMTHVYPDMSDKIVTLYDVVDKNLIEKMADEENPFAGENVDYIFTTVARLEKPKGYDIATRACKILKDRGLSFKWFIVGEGSERKNIEKDIADFGIEDNFVLVGAKENPYTYIKNADVYIQTSKFEGYCLTLCEARLLNIPAVSTAFDVVHNQLVNGENGLIVDMNGEAVADGVMRMISDSALREKITDNLKKEKKGNAEEREKLYKLIEQE